MMTINCGEVLNAVDGKLMSGDINTVFNNISTDSRKVSEDDLFKPLKGDKFDGHDYISSCFEKGATGSLTQKEFATGTDRVIIKVDDTLKALRDLASYYRERFQIPFVGITGSVGKTSTKDMVSSVLATCYSVLKTQGNFNNEIGVPLTIFNLEDSHNAAVVEMGMRGLGEISRLTSIV